MKEKIGLVLGGGGARGAAYIGVLRALEENNIKFDFIVGTSIGSVAGAALAYGVSSTELYDIAKTLSTKDIKPNLIPFMPSSTDGIAKMCERIFKDKSITFEDLKTTFCAVATDLRTGEEYDIIKGDLIPAICASCGVPGIFYPVTYDNTLLADGGLVNNIPSSVAKKFGCTKIVAVDLHSKRGEGTDSDKFFDLLLASIKIMMKSNSQKGYLDSDIMIQPDLAKFNVAKIENIEDMIKEGYLATIRKMPEIKRIFGEKLEVIDNKTDKNQIKYKI